MDLFEAIRERRSVRAWADRDVEEEKLEQVLNAARLAPSANNRQEWKFVVVRDPELRRQIAEAANGQWFVGEAPVVIAACAVEHDHVMSCGHPSFLVDLAIAIDHMALAARALGLGTCWIGAFDADKTRELLGIPGDVVVVGMLPIGYPKASAPDKNRMNMDEILFEEKWEE